MRRRKQQAAWRARNPDYFRGRRIQVRGSADPPPEPLRLPPPLNQLPWDIAQSEFGVQGADFIGVMGALLLRPAQSKLHLQDADSRKDPGALPHVAAQSQMKTGADWSGAGNARDASGISPT